MEVTETKSVLALAGETGTWVRAGEGWQPIEETGGPETFTVLDDDPLRPEVELRAPAGTLRHRYGLSRASETLFASLAALSSVLRPPPFALFAASVDHSAVAEAKPDEALLVLDPLLGGGYRWLLVPNLLLHAVLVALVVRELRRRGVAGVRLAGWALAVACAGAFSGPVILALEPRRAWKTPARSAPPPPLVRAA